jgi:Tol biopolymer transport system component
MNGKTKTNMCLIILLAFLIYFGGNSKADFTFGEPVNLGPTVNTSYGDCASSISSDGLSLYFCDSPLNPTPGGYGGGDLWVTTRETTGDEWGPRMNLGPTVNTSFGDGAPCMSADGLSLYFSSNRLGGYGNYDLWMSTRTTTKDDWGAPVNLGPIVNTSADENFTSISADGLQLYVSDPWGEPSNLGPTVNSSAYDGDHCISADGLSLYFCSTRPGGLGGEDIWVTRRATVSDPWAPPVNLGPSINSSAHDTFPNFSADGSTLYFSSRRPGGFGGYDLWQVSINPVVDLNGDGIVDAEDMCIMVDHWGTDNSLCDIGPMPWGDGVVDVQDLIVLAEHLFEEVPPVE